MLVPEFPPALEQVICTALALDPAHRYASAAAMIEALEAVASVEGWIVGTQASARMMQELWSDDAPTRGRPSPPRIGCHPRVAA